MSGIQHFNWDNTKCNFIFDEYGFTVDEIYNEFKENLM